MAAHRIRVLVVDDSALMRRLVSDLVESSPDFLVVAKARDGREALEKLHSLRPDVITLDIEMPVMDGMKALAEIMSQRPTPVVMLSSRTHHGAVETMRCLEMGAVDFVCKPPGAISTDISKIRAMLLLKLRMAASAKLLPTSTQRRPPAPHPCTAAAPSKRAKRLVLIGSSTGGPRALEEIIPRFPADLAAAVLIAQHMPGGFTRAMAERLNALSQVDVREAGEGDEIAQGSVLIGPGGRHLLVARQGRARISDEAPVWGVRPAADVLLDSAAAAFGPACVGVILTGMGRDGARGLRAIREAGGCTMAQDQATSVVWGMPRVALEEGAAETAVPLPEIADRILAAVGRPPRVNATSGRR